jgi:hypothetical protein
LVRLGGDLPRGLHADVGNQQLLFQLFKQIIVDFLTAEQTDKSGTEVCLVSPRLRLRRAKNLLWSVFPALTARHDGFVRHHLHGVFRRIGPPEPVLPALHR